MPLTIVRSTQPAPLKPTDGTGHMVAAGYFLYDRFALFATLDRLGVLPGFDFVLEDRVARFMRMGFVLAFGAYLAVALGTFKYFFLLHD